MYICCGLFTATTGKGRGLIIPQEEEGPQGEGGEVFKCNSVCAAFSPCSCADNKKNSRLGQLTKSKVYDES